MIRILAALSILWMLQVSRTKAAEAGPVDDDRSVVYRLEPAPGGDTLVRVPREEVRPGLAYNYYNARLGQRAWGFARSDGTFQYAFGEGTTLPIERLDLGLSAETEAKLLDEFAPGVRERLAITGATPAVEMTAEGTWRLLDFRTSPRIFDVQTGHRWEWHGGRRAAVVHTYGDTWRVVNGRYRPAAYPSPMPVVCGPFHRAGSALFLTRTPEPLP